MSKPGRHEHKLSNERSRFTDRDELREIFQRHLNSATEAPVLMFYGIGGAGKSWLLQKLREEIPADVPAAILDFDPQARGQRFVQDPASALYEIRRQLDCPASHFDLAFAMLRHKQGATDEPGLRGEGAVGAALDVATEVVQKAIDKIPGVNVLARILSKEALALIKGTPLEEFIASKVGSEFVLSLRKRTAQEIDTDLLHYLAKDLRENLPVHLGRAARAVILFDTFEAVGAGLQNEEHRRHQEEWIRDIAGNFEFALIITAGQNRLTWDGADFAWADPEHLEQHLVGGLSKGDARDFLLKCGIDDEALQEAILATAYEPESGGHHCFSLGLCADIVHAGRTDGEEPRAETLRLAPRDWEALARRFLKSLDSDGKRRWIERLALTPRFDERAARAAYSSAHSAAQDVAWEGLQDYSFVHRLANRTGWFAIRPQMRWALENQPSAQERVQQDHEWWRGYWLSNSKSRADAGVPLCWYHWYCLDPGTAFTEWHRLIEAARSSVSPRILEHFRLLAWWEPVGLLEAAPASPQEALVCYHVGIELGKATLGSPTSNLHRAISCHEAALSVFAEQTFPYNWASAKTALASAWANIPTGNQTENLLKAINYLNDAARLMTEQEFPEEWANIQLNLGAAWLKLPTGNRVENLRKAIGYNEAALRVLTETAFPHEWARMQLNLGAAWWNMPTGNRAENLRNSIGYGEAALRVFTEHEFPQEWARTQNHLGISWNDLRTGNLADNLAKAIGHYEASCRVYTELEFPAAWAMSQNNLGIVWQELATGNVIENLEKAIGYCEAALRVYNEIEYPLEWAMTQETLGNAFRKRSTGNRVDNVEKAISCYEAALRIRTEKGFPIEWARTNNNLGIAWKSLPSGERDLNLRKAISCYDSALRVRSEHGFPQDWAGTQNNIGNAWMELAAWAAQSDKDWPNWAAYLHAAVDHFVAALRVFTQEGFPQEYAAASAQLRVAREVLEDAD